MAEQALQKSHDELELRVEERTTELARANEVLQEEIAERQLAEQGRQESEEKYRLLVSQIPAMVFQGYGDWSIDPLDEKIEVLTGYSKEDFDSRRVKWCDLIPADDLDYAEKVFIEALKTDKSYVREHRLRKKDGEIIWVQCHGQIFLNDQGKVDHISGVSFDVTERRQAEEAVREGERFLADVFASIQDGINIMDTDYNIIRVNPTLERWYDHARPLVGKKCYEVIHGGREPCESCPYRQTLETGQAAYKVTPRKGKDGAEVGWIEVFTFPIMDKATGQVKGVIQHIRDITERQQALASLQESEQKFRLLVTTVPAMVYRGYADWTVDFFDEKVEKLTGYAVEDFNSRRIKWSEIILAEDLEGATEIFKRALRTNRSYVREYRIKERSGAIHWIRERGQIICDEKGRIDYVTGVYSDITKEHEMEAALERLRLHNEMILNSAGEGIVGLDLTGKVTFVNPAVVSLTGYEPKELLGQNFHLLVHHQKRDGAPYPEEECPIYHTIRDGKGHRVTDDLVWTKEGKPLPVDYVTTPIEDGGQVVGAVGVFRDITERKQAEEALHRSEEQLRQAVKMEAVGRLAGGVAHDFNNILTAITGYGELLLMNLDQQDPQRQDVQDILVAAERAATLTRQLLAFSRKQVLQPQRLDLNRVVANMDKMLRRIIGEDIDLVTVLGPEPGTVTADPGQIEQVIMNLAVNARDAMPQGGKLTIETADADLDEAYAQNHLEAQPGPYVMLAVSDTGVGLDQEGQARIFEPFFTTKELGKGTGLGLSTVYGIVKQSGGLIWVYSEPGKGTTFKIYLPRLEAAGDLAAGLGQVPDKCDWGSETVLLVEDEDMVRHVARRILARHGYTVLEAASGDEALAISRENAGPIHLMLTDVVMPGMSGWEIMENLKPERPGMKVLFMSGHTENAIVHHGVLDPGTAFIQKPFKHTVLTHKIREVLDNPVAG
ncbi:MAG: PAS domain S-box protein [Pseudomonadota bacterium]